MNFLIDKKNKEKNIKLKEYFNNSNIINFDDFNIKFILKNIHLSNDVFNDIEYFNNNFQSNINKCGSVYDNISKYCSLNGSKYILKNILENPIDNKYILENRVNTLYNYNNTDEDYNILNKNENNILVLFEENEKYIEDLLNIVYFKFNIINKSSHCITAYNIYRILISPLIGILSPIIYFIIPFLIFKIKLKLQISFKEYIKLIYQMMKSSLFNPTTNIFFSNSTNRFAIGMKYITIVCNLFTILFYFQGIFNSIEISKTVNSICKNIIEKFNNAIVFLKDAVNKKFINEIDNIINNYYFNYNFVNYEIEKSYIDSLNIIDYSFFNNFGKQLKDYKYKNKEIIKSILIKVWFLDFIRTCNKFKNENNFCYPQYININNTIIKNLKHPCLDIKKVVGNKCILKDNNMIITGPNAGGKSTYIKSLLINVLLNQTICISNSEKCITSIYSNVISQINIPDCKGKESLFEAEMNRCLSTLNILKKNNKNTIIIMDEIFNSTNPVEGISAAYAVVKKMNEFKNCKIIFTTHYNYLTNLSKEKFINYKMESLIDNDDIIFPYKLKKGISTQYIALELLKKNGFDKDIIENAINIKNLLPKI